MRKIVISFFILLLNVSVFWSNNISSGLTFVAHTDKKENRTSLVLNPDKTFSFPNGFTLEFDLKLHRELHNFGYVFRILSNDKMSFDLLCNISDNIKSLSLVEGNNLYLSFLPENSDYFRENDWNHIKVIFGKNRIHLSVNNKTIEAACNYDSFDDIQIFFGSNNSKKFATSDVPPMSIRNISILNDKRKQIAYWPLKEHAQTEVFDSIAHYEAVAKNPIWEIDKHTKWILEDELQLPELIQAAYNEELDCIYFAVKSDLYKYSLNDNQLDSISVKKGNAYFEKNNQLIFNPYLKQLCSYDLNQNDIAVFNFETNEWSCSDLEIKNPAFSQHNAFISSLDSCLYVFGGYGNYQYKNSLLKKKNDSSSWQNIDYTPKIPPRYLSGLGFLSPDTVLIFGGYGNEQGNQELGMRYYYDLYWLDLKTMKSDKVWERNDVKEDFVVGNSIIVNKEQNKFFALCFANNISNSHILLKSFDLSTAESTIYADSIPFEFNDVRSFCTLYYNVKKSVIYAITVYNNEDKGKSDVKIYSLLYPPLVNEDIHQRKSAHTIILIAIIAAILVTSVLLYYYIRKKKHHKVIEKNEMEEENPIEFSVPKEPVKYYDSAILFLGGFRVRNKNGENITQNFSPILKQLLILLILYTKKDTKGISDVALKDLLWPDKSEEKAQNNRRVNMHKLKILLDELDGVVLEKRNAFWTLDLGEKTYCDYIEACDLIVQIRKIKNLNAEDAMKLLPDFFTLQLLPFTQIDWLDEFKSEYSNSVIDTMTSLSKQSVVKKDNKLLIHIANIIFTQDKADEYALQLKCRALYDSGKVSQAKAVFDTFCMEYKNLLDADYPKTFKDILHLE